LKTRPRRNSGDHAGPGSSQGRRNEKELTKIRILADPGITHNTHEIHYRGEAGRFTMKFENVPGPANPKTTYLACLSVLAALKNIRSPYRVGT